MRLPRNLGAIVAGLSFAALLGGWSVAALSPPAIQQPAAIDPSATAETSAPAAESIPGLLPSAPPPSPQTLLDERREAMFDAFGWRDATRSPGWAAYQDGMDRYRDARRAWYGQRRDDSRQHHDSWLDVFCPWSRPQRKRFDLRSDRIQRERLDWQERWDALMYGQPWGVGAPNPR